MADELPAGWEDGVRKTHAEASGAGEDSFLEPLDRFPRGVARVLGNRRRELGGAADPPAYSVFLLLPDRGEEEGLPREPWFDMGKVCLTGKVWYVGPSAVVGHGRDLDAETPDDVCRHVEALGLGDVPAVIVDPRGDGPTARFFPTGLSVPRDYKPVRLVAQEVNLNEIVEITTRLYETTLFTPDAQPPANRLWKDPAKRCPVRDAEACVQSALIYVLAQSLHPCKVYFEIPGKMGRADVHITYMDDEDKSIAHHLAVIELKVLRSRGETGTAYSEKKNEEWVEEGVLQAKAYQSERGHREAALFCFDMRDENVSDEECFAHVRELATQADVRLQRWYLYSSSKAARRVV